MENSLGMSLPWLIAIPILFALVNYADADGMQAPSTSPRGSTHNTDVWRVGNTEVFICNKSHLCATRDPPCFDGPIEHPLACYCDVLCMVFNDCCLDYEQTCLTSSESIDEAYSFSTDAPSTTQYTVTIDFAAILGVEPELYACNTLYYAYHGRNFGFMVVSRCPRGKYIPQCEDDLVLDISEDETTYNFHALHIPVTSGKTGIAYKNTFCALCNGEWEDLHYWQLRYSVEGDLSEPTVTLSLKKRLLAIGGSYERVTWYPPTTVQTRVIRACVVLNDNICRDQSSSASRKNMNAYVTNTDKEYISAFYSNCLTYLNGKMNCSYQIPLLTKTQESKYLVYDIPRVGVIPVSTIIDFAGSTKIDTVQITHVLESITCPMNQVFDPSRSECVPLSCIDGLVVDGDRCVARSSGFKSHCPEDVQEWTLEFHKHRHLSCNKHLPVHFDCLDGKQIPVDFIEILSLSGRLKCRYDILVNVSMWKDGQRYSAIVDELLRGDTCVKNFSDNRFTFSNAQLYSKCITSMQEMCDSKLVSFTPNVTRKDPNGKLIYYISELDKWFTGDVIERTSYANGNITGVTTLACLNPRLTCPYVSLNQTLFTYIAHMPGYIEYRPTQRVLPPGQYKVAEDGQIHACSLFFSRGTRNVTSNFAVVTFSFSQSIISVVGSCISLIALLMTFLTYARFSSLRRCVCNKLIMVLCAAIFTGQLMLLVTGQAGRIFILCTFLAASTHYVWLVAFALTFSLAYELNRTFGSHSINRFREDDERTFRMHLFNSFGTPLLIVIPCLVIQFENHQNVIYAEDGVCWISDYVPMVIAFGVPVGITLCFNTFLFTYTVIGIFKTKRLSRKILLHHPDRRTFCENLKEVLIYFKISTLMGFTWFVGFAAAYIQTDIIWYIFVALNSLQGAFIFLAFTCNGRVWRLWMQGMAAGLVSSSIKKSVGKNGEVVYNANGHDMKTIDRMVERVTRI